jgi:valyl-tRNA synthetase
MPFITEEIYKSLPATTGSIMVSQWPEAGSIYDVREGYAKRDGDGARHRNLRAEMNVPANRKAEISILASGESSRI